MASSFEIARTTIHIYLQKLGRLAQACSILSLSMKELREDSRFASAYIDIHKANIRVSNRSYCGRIRHNGRTTDDGFSDNGRTGHENRKEDKPGKI
jgi:hypothetical protein